MPNRLSHSTSPYLLQHADNPVDWHEWGDEAFKEARQRNVPILLSVGYSACHWCHVMAHESFEDPVTAAEMNQLFVNIKVDREERPDVDAIYMEAVQAMSGHGGWPMTVFLTPELEPFFAGTYFPREDRAGIPSFRKVMGAITEAWRERPSEVFDQAERVVAAISNTLPVAETLASGPLLESAYHALAASFDPAHGGFGGAPKFPQQPSLEFLLRIWNEPWASQARTMLTTTLLAMAGGGIHDQLGGGFARYSVDPIWLVPHFEKMLYDNAQLARLYLWAGIEFDDQRLLDVARSTLDYLLTDLRHPDGGLFSAEDADSEGVEGKFYVWSYEEFMAVAGENGPLAARHFGVTSEGNFEGTNILTLAEPLEEVAHALGLDSSNAAARLDQVKGNLLARRARRVRPGLDDKVLAAWNGLAVRALAEAGAALDEPRYLEAAQQAADFVLGQMTTQDGTVLRSWAKGRPSNVSGFLDDYAAMGVGLLSLYAATGEPRWFEGAADLLVQIQRFADPVGGFFTSEESGDLPKRAKDLFDNPSPSGNSLAAEGLLLLSLYTGDAKQREAALSTLGAQALIMERYPTAAMYALAVLHSIHRGTHELAIVGPDPGPLRRIYWERLRPHIVLATSPGDETRVPLLRGRFSPGSTLAYLCSGFTCLAPVKEPAALTDSLAST
ncbi:MAG TPA: thioredoxin domain-containing protein [Acidimicrobiia bacterium]|nr:thioredoxin domain-containing protein [Acidimicrobiia bacterium]